MLFGIVDAITSFCGNPYFQMLVTFHPLPQGVCKLVLVTTHFLT
jgi:hypothetical protein